LEENNKTKLWRERLKTTKDNTPKLPLYKQVWFQTVAALIPVVIGLTAIWDKISPYQTPSGHYIEILVEASDAMLISGADRKPRWPSVLFAVKKHFSEDLHRTDYVALRTFGGSCSDGNGSQKLLGFSADARRKVVSKLSDVIPKGKPTFEAGIIGATSDFKNLEHNPNVYRRIIAIVGSSSFCSSDRISEIASNRLRDKYNFDIVVIGFDLDIDQIKPLKEFSKSEFVSNVLFVNSKEGLLKAMEWATDIGTSEAPPKFAKVTIGENIYNESKYPLTANDSQELNQKEAPTEESLTIEESRCYYDDSKIDTNVNTGAKTSYASTLKEYAHKMCGGNEENAYCPKFSVVEDFDISGIHAFRDSIRFNSHYLHQHANEIQMGLLAHEVAHFMSPKQIVFGLPLHLYPSEVSTINGVPINESNASFLYTELGKLEYWQSWENRYFETIEYINTGCNLAKIGFLKEQFKLAEAHLINFLDLSEKVKAVRRQSLNIGFALCGTKD